MSNLKLYHQIIIRDRDGKVVRKTRKRISKSFVIGFLKLLMRNMYHAYGSTGTTVSIIDTLNSAEDFVASTAVATQMCLSMDAPVNDGSYGVVIGTGNTAPTNTDYALETIIVHGSGATQLSHGAINWIVTQVVGANVDLVLQRAFINNSGGTINVEEIGMYLKDLNTDPATKVICIARDVTGTVAVLNGQTCTVEYTFRTTV